MGLGDLLKRLVRGAPPSRLATHRTEPEAIDVARRAVGDHWLRNALNVASPQRHASGAVVWIVETGGVGSSLRLVIDDESGEVLERSERNTR